MAERRPNSKKLLPRARQMRQQPSDAERKLWSALRNRQLDGMKFRRQVPIGNFIADFACDEAKLIVEVDGSQHGEQQEYDENRTKQLNALGWRVIRFAAWDVVKDLDAVLATILRERGPHPSPLP